MTRLSSCLPDATPMTQRWRSVISSVRSTPSDRRPARAARALRRSTRAPWCCPRRVEGAALHGAATALGGLGGVLRELGRPDEALAPLQRAVELAQSVGD